MHEVSVTTATSSLLPDLASSPGSRGPQLHARPHQDSLQQSPASPGHTASFQDQLRSKLEARKRSLEGAEVNSHHHGQESPEKFHLPLSEAQATSYKGRGRD